MSITYLHCAKVTSEQIAELYDSAGLQRPIKDLIRIQKMIDNSDLIMTAWDQERLVGAARAITDYSYCCYLSDLAVHNDYQKQGIGSELVKHLQSLLGDEVMVLLLSVPEAMNYYPKLGFEKIENAFLIPRKR